MKLSIIVPVYNVELYIKQCLESIINQKDIAPDSYEIIVVNDGTPDRSMDIVNNIDWKGIHHIVLNQENMGLSAARNRGLEVAIGDYVWFVDSDDYISPNSVSLLLQKMEGADIINIGYIEVHDGVLIPQSSLYPYDTGTECLIHKVYIPAQFHIYRMCFLKDNNLKFYKGIYHEDMEFTPRVLFLASKVETVSEGIYYYRIRTNSIVTTPNVKRAFDYLVVAKSLTEFSMSHNIGFKRSPFLPYINMTLNNALYIIKDANYEKKVEWNNIFTSYNYYIQSLRYSNNKKYKLEGVLFHLFPKYCISIYKLLLKMK